MKKFKLILVMIISLGLTTSCDKSNVLTEYSKTDSDDAIYIEAKKEIDNEEWQDAIDHIQNDLSASYQARRDVQNTLVSALAGKCGLTFFDLVNGIKNSSSTKIFSLFMSIFGGKVLDTASCDQAILILQGFGAKASRTTAENVRLALLGITRIGTTLGAKLDSTDHNGVIDIATATICRNGDAGAETDGWWAHLTCSPWNFPTTPAGKAQYLSDTDIEKVVLGLGLVFENVDAFTSALDGSGTSTLGSLDDAKDNCESAMEQLVGAGTSCEFTTSSDLTAALGTNKAKLLYAYRLMLESSALGFNSCDIADNIAYITDGATSAPPGTYTNYCCPATMIPGTPDPGDFCAP